MMKKLFLIALLGGLGVQLNGQSDLTLYNFNCLPQSLHTNPAYPQQTRVWVGIPVLSGVQTYYHNNGFTPIDIFEKGTDINQNIEKAILNLDDKSVVASNETVELLGIGFRLGNGFFTMGAQQEVDFRMVYPVDLLELIWFGNADQQYRTTNLAEFDMESITRTNYYIGYQADINDKLSLGGRMKYIVGQGHGYVDRMNAMVTTDDNSNLIVETDILIRTAGIATYVDMDANPFNVKTHVFSAKQWVWIGFRCLLQTE